MFFVDEPYVSDFFKQTVKDHAIPVVSTQVANTLGLFAGTKLISEDEAMELARSNETYTAYTTSENSIGWIAQHLAFSELPGKIELFKDKLMFRELTKSMFPSFIFKEVLAEDLDTINIHDLPLPFIIKPTVGFFSMGVYKVSSVEEWAETVDSLQSEMGQIKDLYPDEVLNAGSFIIEQFIYGEEYAIDAYFNASGEAVILSILRHVFSSDTDVSDRVYITSKDIIEGNLVEFTNFVSKIGELAQVKNFAMHIELRRDNKGFLLPIEVNPARFGGWCTTADITHLAYGFNPYVYYFSQIKPDWSQVLGGKENKLYSVVVLDNSTGIDTDEITSFNYEKLLSQFENPLELRKVDYKKYPLFGFLFTETRKDNYGELKAILHSDLSEFTSTKKATD